MKLGRLITNVITFILILICMPVGYIGLRELGKTAGLVSFPVPVAGTGSMYPSLYWSKEEGGPDDASALTLSSIREEPLMYRYFGGHDFMGKTLLRSTLSPYDMVAFKNQKTVDILSEEKGDVKAGFIKRLIGMPGDTIEVRDGFVLKNGKAIEEPYIESGRSTYGGVTIQDCTPIKIPAGHYLVMGDNRKVSSDSRGELGLIAESDILYYLPFSKQAAYHSLWRDATGDSKLAATPTLDVVEATRLLNDLRKEKKVAALTLSPKLNKSASLRGVKILASNDFSTAATISGYPMRRAMADVGYDNKVTGEVVSRGFFSAKEWLASLTYYAKTTTQLIDPVYQDVGIAAVTGNVNGCPSQVVVGHFGGYVPPNYDQATINSWTKLRENLESVLPGWKGALDNSQVNQDKLKELLRLLEKRLALAREVESTMKNNKWTTSDQDGRIKQDLIDSDLAEKLVTELNK